VDEKRYSNDEITVIWRPSLCQHSTHCWKEMIQVFDPRRKPWIQLNQGSTDDVIAQVKKCPSGALTWEKNEDA